MLFIGCQRKEYHSKMKLIGQWKFQYHFACLFSTNWGKGANLVNLGKYLLQ